MKSKSPFFVRSLSPLAFATLTLPLAVLTLSCGTSTPTQAAPNDAVKPDVAAPATAAVTAPVQAKRANDLIDKMGIVRGVSGATVNDLGFRHVRDNVVGRDAARNNEDYANYGIRLMTAVHPTTPERNLAALKKGFDDGVIEIIEGPNEVDLWPKPYKDKNHGAAAYLWQKDFYPVFKADPEAAKIPIASFTYANLYYYGEKGPLSESFDYANVHQYFWNDNIRDDKVKSLSDNANKFMVAGEKPKPIVVGEFGWTTGPGGDYPLSEKAQAKYIPRGFLKYFARDEIMRSYLYNMIDKENQNYGLMRGDESKKPSYYAVKNLIGELAEGSWNKDAKKWELPDFKSSLLDFGMDAGADSNCR